MATTIDYASDYGGEASDYQTTMKRLCPLKQGIGIDGFRKCDGSRCSWWDAGKSRCSVLSLARNK